MFGRSSGEDPALTVDGPTPVDLADGLIPDLLPGLDLAALAGLSRADLAQEIKASIAARLGGRLASMNLLEQRDLVARVVDAVEARIAKIPDPAPAEPPPAEIAPPPTAEDAPPARPKASLSSLDNQVAAEVYQLPTRGSANETKVREAKARLGDLLMERIDATAAAAMERDELEREIADIVAELLVEQKIQLNVAERQTLVDRLLDDMLGLGPLEPLLEDESITDIMVNGPRQVFVERKGKLTLTGVHFRDNSHVMAIATRIVTRIGRRVDESTPLVDARLEDGSRVNIIIPPLAIDGPSISIRKFAKKKITLDVMERQENLSPAMATALKIAARSRLNILISGGTGSGKTTLLNALSRMIDTTERIVTIEDAAELQLQQPHVVRLETRPANLEGQGEITMRELVKNALRMRPDRIILGEIRGSEALDMLQAMNTGHDGSLSTIHANRPREALTRLENMVGMSGINLAAKAVRTQIASAVDMIVQISRMRDGVRRITYVSEIVGMEGDIVTMQDLFWYEYVGEKPNGMLIGDFKSAAIRPHFTQRAAYYGLDAALMECM